ncbi:MAG: VWA domain-containing protein, partial [Chloroflexales bacterium]|nr:VWA domain-containing protein [Chloroflexales bacterium]
PAATLAPAAEAVGSEAPGTGAAEPHRPSAPEASLKAGEIDDNAAFADYLAYLRGYQWADVRPADVSERYLISVIDDSQRPVLDARVTVYDGERAIFRGRTYAGGKTIFMPRLFDTANSSELRVVAEYGQARAETTLRRGEAEQVELGLRGAEPDNTLRLDLLFLLDTTGSMGDELGRIQDTIDSIAARIDGFTPRPQIRYSLVAYKDAGDEYVTRPFDFTTDLTAFRQQLGALSALGGGDTPEALDEALYEGVARASWSDEPAVRLAFLVADAGPHVPGGAQFSYLDGAREAAARGVKIYPIAASNTDPQAEYVFRQLAQQTMGGFVFLTYQEGASSGAPGESTPLEAGEQPYTVERLDDLIVSIVERELAAAVGAR